MAFKVGDRAKVKSDNDTLNGLKGEVIFIYDHPPEIGVRVDREKYILLLAPSHLVRLVPPKRRTIQVSLREDDCIIGARILTPQGIDQIGDFYRDNDVFEFVEKKKCSK